MGMVLLCLKQMFSYRNVLRNRSRCVALHRTSFYTHYLQQYTSPTYVGLFQGTGLPRLPRPLNITCPSQRKEQWSESLSLKLLFSRFACSVRGTLQASSQGKSRHLPSGREGHMHCSIASDDVIPKHIRSVDTEYNLWPLERTRLVCRKTMEEK